MPGSLVAAPRQGVMLGRLRSPAFRPGLGVGNSALFVGVSLAAGYTLLGACWLLLKTEGELQRRAVAWARRSSVACRLRALRPSRCEPLVSSFVFHKWFSFPKHRAASRRCADDVAVLFAMVGVTLRQQPRADEAWRGFRSPGRQAIFVLGSSGSLQHLPLRHRGPHDASGSRGRTQVADLHPRGAVITLPVMAASSAYSYWVSAQGARAVVPLKERKPSDFASTLAATAPGALDTRRWHQLFRGSARTNGWLAVQFPTRCCASHRPRQMGPTAANSQPMRVCS